MDRVDVNKIAEEINSKLEKAGKLFRLQIVNLIETNCSHCDNKIIIEHTRYFQEPICDECHEEMYWNHVDDDPLEED